MENRSAAAFCRPCSALQSEVGAAAASGIGGRGAGRSGKVSRGCEQRPGLPSSDTKRRKKEQGGPSSDAVVEAGIFIASATILRKVPGLGRECARGTLVTWVIIIEGLSQSIYKSVV